MSYCLNPNCQKPQNINGMKFCQTCGAKLLLRERYRGLKIIGLLVPSILVTLKYYKIGLAQR